MDEEVDKQTGLKSNKMTEKELLDDLELNQKILTNTERTDLETNRVVQIGNQTITLNGEHINNTVTGVYAKLYSYKDGREGKVLELCSNPDYVDDELNLEDDYNLHDIGQMKEESWRQWL